MERALAHIESVKEVFSIEGADRVEALKILGWTLVGKKGDFKVGDRVVFVEPDAILPFAPWSDFLRYKDKPDKPIRIKTVKIRKCISQGICFPLSILPEGDYAEGQNVQEILGIVQYQPNIPANLSGKIKGNFPHFLRKTDSQRIQSYPDVINEFKDKEIYCSLKIDGTSSSFYFKDGQFGICSRNLELKEDDTIYWKMAKQYNLEETLTKLRRNICIQAECYGVGIQGNKLGLNDNKLAVFDIWDIDSQSYLNYDDFIGLVNVLGLESAPILYRGQFKWNTVEELLDFADTIKYKNGSSAEGIVIRPVIEAYSQVLRERLAIKSISRTFLLKNGE